MNQAAPVDCANQLKGKSANRQTGLDGGNRGEHVKLNYIFVSLRYHLRVVPGSKNWSCDIASTCPNITHGP